MKKSFLLPLAAILSLTLVTGCTRTSYAIHTVDGRTIISDGKPTEAATGLLGYVDSNGFKQQINKSDVKSVSELPK